MDVNWTPQTVAAVLAFIGMLVFVHELGHFLTAKFFDIKVLKFSLGFGPPLVAFTRGETTYQIAAIPLGGFVKMAGDNPHEEVAPEDHARSFMGAPVYQRAIVSFAGPAMNLLFPVLCFFAYNILEPEEQVAEVGTVELGTPAARAGLQRGDRILSIAGNVAALAEAVRFAQASHLDMDKVYEASSGGAAQSWQMDNRWSSMDADEFDFGFAIDWMRKDLGLSLDEGRGLGVSLPVAGLVDQFFAEIQAMGGGRLDTSAIVKRLPRKKT